MPYALYVHIPYCRSRCHYCNFYTAAVQGGVPQPYISALLRDFYRYAPKGPQGAPLPPKTVYFGGGTPSLLTPAQVDQLLTAFAPEPNTEITLEANPDTVTFETLAAWRKAGINRLSFGVQTANNASLARLGRPHTAGQAQTALQWAARAGFTNITGDIMMALPGYSQAEFDETLALLQQNGAVHISAYLLKIEPGTPFGASPPPNLPTEEQAADFYLYAVEALQKAGYAQYEISNFAQPGYEGRHNLAYWNCEDYLGLGPSAHSCLQNKRFSFAPGTGNFIDDTLAPQPQGVCNAEDYIMLQLRLTKGLALPRLRQRYGQSLTPQQTRFLQQLQQSGLAHQTGGAWALTPQGLLVQNAILARLFNL